MKRNSRKKTEINIRIGGRLKRFRIKNGISADELAEAFGIVKDSLLRIENGSTGLSSEYAYILATRYNCDMNYIISRNPE
jgi:transcriptional regulator with XRE-family HTH domain